MRSKFLASTLAIGLGFATPMVSAIGFSEGATAQEQASEIDRVIGEGLKLSREGSLESLRKAIIQFDKALQFSQ